MVLEFEGRRDTATKNTKKRKVTIKKKQFLGVVVVVLQIKTILWTL